VYLSHVPASSDLHAYRTGFIDLGALKGNRGSQNYAIPAGTDLRELAHGIYPAVLGEAGVAAALATLADTAPLPVQIRRADDRRYPARSRPRGTSPWRRPSTTRPAGARIALP
jgi:hypothetical protein